MTTKDGLDFEAILKEDSETDLYLPTISIDILGCQIDITKKVTDLILKYNPRFKKITWLAKDKQ